MKAFRPTILRFLSAAALAAGAVAAGQTPAPPRLYNPSPPAQPPADAPGRGWELLPTAPSGGAAPSEQVQRMKAERDALRAAREAQAPPPAAPGDDALAAERLRLKARLLELIEKFKNQPPPAAGPRPAAENRRTDPAAERARVVEPIRQIQNLYQAGDFQAAIRAVPLIDTSNLSRQHAALLRYVQASCHRKLGELAQARALYKELAEAKDDPFIAECASWHLMALQTRAELLNRIGTNPPAGPNPRD